MFREFKVGELFEVVGNKQVKSQKHIVERADGIPFVVQSTKNNMVKCHVDRQALLDGGETVYDGNAIVLGVVSPVASYQENEFGASQSITLRADFLNPTRGLYLVTVIRKVIESKYSYTNLPGIQKYKEDVIQLPVKPGTDEVNYTEDDIDWCYMESYIQELEESYIQELDAYLKETGLDDYTLTDDEREVLEREPVFKEFKVGELFDGVSGDTDIKKAHLDGDGYPVITAGVDNLGVAGYSSVTAKILPSNTLTVDMFGNCYFRPFEYKMVTHARVFSLCSKDGQLTPETGLFVCTMLKWLSTKYNYSNMCSYNKIKNETIKLPVKPGTDEVNYTEADIDWDYIEAYVRVMEKQVIADVVDYKNEVIATTKELVHTS